MAFLPLSNRLLEAGANGDISLLRKLFNNKVKTEDVTDENGNTPLMLAVQNNHTYAAKLFIEYGADIEHKNKQFNRPVHLAAMGGNAEMLALLLGRGAKFNQLNHEGFSPIQYTHTGTKVHNLLSDAQNGKIVNEFEQIDDVPVIPAYTIPAPKVKAEKKGKKDKKKGKKGKKKRK